MRPGERYCLRRARTSSREGPVYGSGACGAIGRGGGLRGIVAVMMNLPGSRRFAEASFSTEGRFCEASRTKISKLRQRLVRLRPTIPKELPDVPHLADQVQVQVGDDDVVRVALADGEHLAARVAEVALAV